MKTFTEYSRVRDIVAWLEINGYETNEENIRMVEAGFLNKAAQVGRKFALPLAAASGLGASAARGAEGPDFDHLPQKKHWNMRMSDDLLYGDKQAQQQIAKDVADRKAGKNVDRSSGATEISAFTHIEERLNSELKGHNMVADIVRAKNDRNGTILIISIYSDAGGIEAYNEFTAKEKFVAVLKKLLAENQMTLHGLRIVGDNQNLGAHITAEPVEEGIEAQYAQDGVVPGFKLLFQVEVVVRGNQNGK